MDREQAVKYLQSSGFSEEQIKAIEGAFSGWGSCVSDNPQKPICPSAGIDCEDCPAYEKKSEWQQDHEILKAYSDGANEVLDNIRAEISKQSRMHMDGDLYIKTSKCMQIIGEYMEEGGDKE